MHRANSIDRRKLVVSQPSPQQSRRPFSIPLCIPVHAMALPTSKSKSKSESKVATRAALIRAAVVAFSEEGLDASLDGICARAGFTRGAFYVHFQNREELLAAAIDERRQSIAASFLTDEGTPRSVLDLLQHFTSAVSRGEFPPKDVVGPGEFLAACNRSERLRSDQLEALEGMRTMIEAMAHANQASGTIRTDVDARAVADLLLLVEAGLEVMVSLGYPFDARAGGVALATMLSKAPIER